MEYKVGDRIKMTIKTFGVAVQDRRGNVIHQLPYVATYIGVVKFVGPEWPFPSAEVVRCSGINVTLKLNMDFQFYPQNNSDAQVVEVLCAA
jgi:hypothetical protein